MAPPTKSTLRIAKDLEIEIILPPTAKVKRLLKRIFNNQELKRKDK